MNNRIGFSSPSRPMETGALPGASSFSPKSVEATIEVMRFAQRSAKEAGRSMDEEALHDIASVFLHYFEDPKDAKNCFLLERQLSNWESDDIQRLVAELASKGVRPEVASLCERGQARKLGWMEIGGLALASLSTVRASPCDGIAIRSERSLRWSDPGRGLTSLCELMCSVADQDVSGLEVMLTETPPDRRARARYTPSSDQLWVLDSDVRRLQQDQVVSVNMQHTLRNELRRREVYRSNIQSESALVHAEVSPINPCASTRSLQALDDCESQMRDAFRIIESTPRLVDLPTELQTGFHAWSGRLPSGLRLPFVGRVLHLYGVQQMFGEVEISPAPNEDLVLVRVPDRPSWGASAMQWVGRMLGFTTEPRYKSRTLDNEFTRENVLWTYLHQRIARHLLVRSEHPQKTSNRDLFFAEVDAVLVDAFGRPAAGELLQLLSGRVQGTPQKRPPEQAIADL